MNRLTKQRVVMHRRHPKPVDPNGPLVWFMEEPDGQGLSRDISLLAVDWQDMGRPEVVTVSVVPGDELNE